MVSCYKTENQMPEFVCDDHENYGSKRGNQNQQGLIRHIIEHELSCDEIKRKIDCRENFFLFHKTFSFKT